MIYRHILFQILIGSELIYGLVLMFTVNTNQNNGFSLIELVTVIVLLAILSIVAPGRSADQDVFAARRFFDDTVVAVHLTMCCAGFRQQFQSIRLKCENTYIYQKVLNEN